MNVLSPLHWRESIASCFRRGACASPMWNNSLSRAPHGVFLVHYLDCGSTVEVSSLLEDHLRFLARRVDLRLSAVMDQRAGRQGDRGCVPHVRGAAARCSARQCRSAPPRDQSWMVRRIPEPKDDNAGNIAGSRVDAGSGDAWCSAVNARSAPLASLRSLPTCSALISAMDPSPAITAGLSTIT